MNNKWKKKAKVEGSKGRYVGNDLVVIVDSDYIPYSAAAASEERTIKVIHRSSGRVKEFKNRSEFYGRGRKKDGGWLGELNEGRETPFLAGDFDIEDVQTPEPLENCLHTIKMMVEGIKDEMKTDNLEFYLGEGNSFRLNISTSLPYKGNRKDMLRPKMLKEAREYMVRKFKAKTDAIIEADDRVIIRAYGDPNAVVWSKDKDVFSQPVRAYCPDQKERGIVDCTGLGELFLEGEGSKAKVRGFGLLHALYQACSEDSSDNYKASHMSEKKFGSKGAYKALVNCKTEKEAVESAIGVYKYLYPEMVIKKTWRGNERPVDWYTMLEEHLKLVYMRRWRDDEFSLDEFLTRYGAQYEY